MAKHDDIGNPEVTIDNLPDAIAKLAEGMKILSTSRLKTDTIITLLHASTGLSKRDIKILLGSLDRLEETYLKPSKR